MNSAEEIPRLLSFHFIIVNDFLCSKNSSESFVLLPFFTFSFFLPHLTLTLSIIKNPTQIRASPAYTLYYIIMQYARRFLPKKTKKRRTSTVIFRRFWRLIMVATTIIMRGPSNGLQRGVFGGGVATFHARAASPAGKYEH